MSDQSEVDDIADILGGLSLAHQPKYVKQSSSMTMAKCHPRPLFRWTSASKSLGIPRGYCEKDVNWKEERKEVEEEEDDEEDEKSFHPSELREPQPLPERVGLATQVQQRDPTQQDQIRRMLLGPQVYQLCKDKKATEFHLEERAYWISKKIGDVCTVEDLVNLCGLKSQETSASEICAEQSTNPELKKFNEMLESQTECAICFEELGTTFTAAGPCGHLFHDDCLKQLIRAGGRQRCPSCRGELEVFKVATEMDYFANGEIMSIQPRKNGKLHGLSKFYVLHFNENSVLSKEIMYDMGVIVFEKQYYTDGTIHKIVNYKNGLKHGLSQEFHFNGKVMWETMYNNSDIVSYKVNHLSGRPS